MTKINEKLAARSTHVEACLGKETFPSPGTASRAAKNINSRRGDGAVRHYKCQYCSKWHIGNTRPATTSLKARRQKALVAQGIERQPSKLDDWTYRKEAHEACERSS